MSTFALIPIEGQLSVPQSRPLPKIPITFGREWALLPPGFCVRTELKALYAALLRTFCLNNEAMLELCRWTPGKTSANRAATGMDAKGASAAGAAAASGVAKAAAAGPAGAAAWAPATGQSASGEYAKRMLTGGAIAVGAASFLGWLAVSHAPKDVTLSPDVLIGEAVKSLRATIAEATTKKVVARGNVVSGHVIKPAAIAPVAMEAPATVSEGAIAASDSAAAAAPTDGVSGSAVVSTDVALSLDGPPASARTTVTTSGASSASDGALIGPPVSARSASNAQSIVSNIDVESGHQLVEHTTDDLRGVAPAARAVASSVASATASAVAPLAASASHAAPSPVATATTIASTVSAAKTTATIAAPAASSVAQANTPALPTAPTAKPAAEAAASGPKPLPMPLPLPRSNLHSTKPTIGHAVSRPAPSPMSAPHVAKKRSVGYSSAGHYSPTRPMPTDAENYASIATSASTYTGNAVTREPTQSRVDTDSTEWASHLSQRRLTDVPDSFSR